MTTEVLVLARLIWFYQRGAWISVVGNLIGITYVAIVHITTYNPVIFIIGKVKSAYIYISLDIFIHSIVRSGVAHGLSVVTAQT